MYLIKAWYVVCLCLLMVTTVHATDTALLAKNVAVIVNTDNPNSVKMGEYYLQLRNIPKQNLIKVSIPNSPKKLTIEQFYRLKEDVYKKIHPDIEVLLMVWTAPYAVECNSITAAMTLGYDAELCKSTCHAGQQSAYFDSDVNKPSAIGLKLSMLLPTDSIQLAKSVIERGVLSGLNTQNASAYFVITADKARNSRAIYFPKSQYLPEKKLTIKTIFAETIMGKQDVMFYQTGRMVVNDLNTLNFLPGALADHLTSTGGDLLNDAQMSSLRWLESGATASYGTVSEPCSYWQKFPNSNVLLKHYLSGSSAIEAYWKSVAWPAQGVFIGEPLAAPYCRYCALR
jgi:uncharacterized protein (TIGR03790 family)